MPRAVIAANHASFLDGLLLGAFLPGEPIFAVDSLIAKQWWAKPFLVFVNALPVDPTNPLSIRSMIRAVEAGSACIIFPEGRITTTGSLMKVYEGPAVIAERTKGRAAADSHRRRRVHGVLAARGQGPSPPAAEDPDSRAAAARADRAGGCERPSPSRRAAPHAPRSDGGLDVRRRADRYDAVRRAARGARAAWRRPPHRRRSRDAAIELSRAGDRQLRARFSAGAQHTSGRARRSCCCRRRAPRWSRSSRCRPRGVCRRC